MLATETDAPCATPGNNGDGSRREIQAWVQLLAGKLGPALERVSLFGSRARGTHGTRSDIDLLVLLEPCDRTHRDVLQDAALEWELMHNLDLSILVLSKSEYARLSRGVEPFWRNFARDEKQLWPTTSTNE